MRRLWGEKYQPLVDQEVAEKEKGLLGDNTIEEGGQESGKRLEEFQDEVIQKYEKQIATEEEGVKKGVRAEHYVALHKCGGCKLVAYCSRTCQSSDWTRHKPFCSKST